MAKKKGKGVKKPAKGGRDFRGFDRKTGKKDSGPGPIRQAMGVAGGKSKYGKPC